MIPPNNPPSNCYGNINLMTADVIKGLTPGLELYFAKTPRGIIVPTKVVRVERDGSAFYCKSMCVPDNAALITHNLGRLNQGVLAVSHDNGSYDLFAEKDIVDSARGLFAEENELETTLEAAGEESPLGLIIGPD